MASSVGVTFCINSEVTGPEVWDEYFGVRADFSHKKGVRVLTPPDRLSSGEGRINGWVMCSEIHTQSEKPEDHLAFMIEILGLPRVDFPEILIAKSSQVLCFCSWDYLVDVQCPLIPAKLMNIFAQSGINLETDTYPHISVEE